MVLSRNYSALFSHLVTVKWIEKGWEVESLSFKPIPVERKIEVIYRIVKGEKIQSIGKERLR